MRHMILQMLVSVYLKLITTLNINNKIVINSQKELIAKKKKSIKKRLRHTLNQNRFWGM